MVINIIFFNIIDLIYFVLGTESSRHFVSALYTKRTVLLKYFKVQVNTDLKRNFIGLTKIIMKDAQSGYYNFFTALLSSCLSFLQNYFNDSTIL